MRIVHIEEAFHPSYGYQVQNFCQHHSREHSIHVLTGAVMRGGIVRADAAELARLDEEFTARTGASIHRLPVAWNWHHKTWLTGLHRKLKELRPDVIFSHGLEYLSLPRVLWRGWDRRCVVVTDSHDMPTAAFHPGLRRLYRTLVQNWCVRRINRRRIICYYTAESTREYLTLYGVAPALQKSLPIGTSVGVYQHDPVARAQMRRTWGAGERDVVLLYTGKHDADKTPHVFYEAARQLKAPSDGRLVVVSVGARDEDYFQRECAPRLEALSAAGVSVVLSPAVPAVQLRDFYSAADIAVFPCRNTLSCLDALACGLPAVMHDDVTNADRLRAGGVVYRSGDTGHLRAVLQELIDDPARRRALGEAGAADIRKRFDYAAVVNGLEEDFERALAARNAARQGPPAG
jgi:glycosyltransferase involved in cell wall biosynthesis